MRKALSALLVSLGLFAAPAMAATVVFEVATADTTTTPNISGNFTPAVGDLIFCTTLVAASLDDPLTLTNSVGTITFTQIGTPLDLNNGYGNFYVFVANKLVASGEDIAQNVTVNPADQGTGTLTACSTVTGMTLFGSSAVRQSKGREENLGVDSTPDATFDASALTGNVTFVAITNVTNPAAITEPTGWTEQMADIGHATPDGGLHFSARASGFTGTNIVAGSTSPSTWAMWIVELDTSAGTPPTLDSAFTVTSETTAAYTLSYDTSIDADNVYVGAYKKDSAAPTCDQIEAGTGTGFVDNDTEAATGSADTIVLTITGGDPFPVYDLYGCAENEFGDSSVTTLADETLDAPAGRQYFIKSGAPGVGEFGLFDDASPAAVDGDYGDVSTLSDSFAQGAGAHTITVDDDTTFVINTAGDTSRQSLTRRFYDVSLAAWSDASPVLLYVNNQSPSYDEDPSELFFYAIDEAITAVPLEQRWSDVEGDAIVVTFEDALPTGLSNTAEELVGTPTACSSQTGYTLRATDAIGDFDEIEFQIQVGPRVPNVSGESGAAATAAIEALCTLTAAEGSGQFSATVAAGLVIDTSPAAGALVEPDATITYSLSLGPGTLSPDAKVIFELSSVTGLVQWTDYIPVAVLADCVPGRYDEDGCWDVQVLSSADGLVAWVDYIPVFEVAQSANKWRYENDGWIPVNTLTP